MDWLLLEFMVEDEFDVGLVDFFDRWENRRSEFPETPLFV